jgi:hypothetical protein
LHYATLTRKVIIGFPRNNQRNSVCKLAHQFSAVSQYYPEQRIHCNMNHSNAIWLFYLWFRAISLLLSSYKLLIMPLDMCFHRSSRMEGVHACLARESNFNESVKPHHVLRNWIKYFSLSWICFIQTRNWVVWVLLTYDHKISTIACVIDMAHITSLFLSPGSGSRALSLYCHSGINKDSMNRIFSPFSTRCYRMMITIHFNESPPAMLQWMLLSWRIMQDNGKGACFWQFGHSRDKGRIFDEMRYFREQNQWTCRGNRLYEFWLFLADTEFHMIHFENKVPGIILLSDQRISCQEGKNGRMWLPSDLQKTIE